MCNYSKDIRLPKKLLNKTKAQIVKELKTPSKEKRRNITFSLDENLIESFKSECERHGLSMNKVVEKLILEFTK